MTRIAIISCEKEKLPHKARAEELYISPLFKLGLKFVKKLKPAVIYILSAKHGLLDLNKIIDPYDITLNHMPAKKRKL